MICPRCQSDEKHLRKEHEGYEQGVLVWTVFHCQRCAFTWRDSEPPESIDHNQRESWFHVDADDTDSYPYNIPIAEKG